MYKTVSEYKGPEIVYNHVIYTKSKTEEFGFHTHDICELIFVKNGEVTGFIGDRTYKLGKNNIILFKANAIHKITKDSGYDYDRYDILFDENKLANKILEKLPKDIDVINCDGNNQITDLFRKLDYYCDNFKDKNLEILVTNLVEEILFNLYLAPTNDISENFITVNPLISSAIEYINTKFTEDINVEEICRQLCITKSHLHHLFMEHLQISPKKYVNVKRLTKARKLIRMGEKPSNIYTSCGFNDYTTFFRNYTSHFGHTPSQENQTSVERKIES